MKTIIWILLSVLAFDSCKKDNSVDSSKVYNDSQGTFINITSADWFTTNESYTSGFTEGRCILGVKLKLIGFTNGDSVKVNTYGDGLIGYQKVKLDSQNTFNDTAQISFSFTNTTKIPVDGFTKSTSLLIFKGSDTLKVILNSGELRYK